MATDNFSATNNPLAAPWATPGGGWNALQSASGECRTGSGSDGDCAMRYTTSTSLRSIVTYASGSMDCGAAHLDASGNGYLFTGYDTNVHIFRVTAGGPAYSQVGADITGTAWNANDRLELKIDGNDLVYLRNDVEIGRRTDATFRTGLAPAAFEFDGTSRFTAWSDGVSDAATGMPLWMLPGPGVPMHRRIFFSPRRLSAIADAQISVTFTANAYSSASGQSQLDLAWPTSAQWMRPGGPGISPDYRQLFRARQFGGFGAISVTFAADGTGLASGTAALLTAAGLVADGRSQASGTALLQTAVQFAADGRSVSSAASVLDTRVTFVADGSGESNTTAALLTAAGLIADGRSTASGTCTLQTVVQFSADGRSLSTATAALTSAGQLMADAHGQSNGTAALQTAVRFVADARAVATTTVTLSGGVTLTASGGSLASAAAMLLTGVRFLADGCGRSGSTAELTVRDGLRADGTGRSASTAALLTGVQLTAAAQAVASASAWLNAAGAFEAVAGAVASASAELTRRACVQPFGPGIFEYREGQFASRRNPYVSMSVPHDGRLVVADEPVVIARFAWADDDGLVRTVYTGSYRLGWVRQVYGPRRATYIDRGLRWIRPGMPVTLYTQGDFWARFAGGSQAGDTVYVSLLDGRPISGYAVDALPTPWRVATSAFPDELAIITTWE